MHKTLLLISLVLVVTLQGRVASSSTEPVPRGATQAQVQEALGQPQKVLPKGPMTACYYEHWEIVFDRNARVVEVLPREKTRQPERRTAEVPDITLQQGGAVLAASNTGRVSYGAASDQTGTSWLQAPEERGQPSELAETDRARIVALDELRRRDPQRGFDMLISTELDHCTERFRCMIIARLNDINASSSGGSRRPDPRTIAPLLRAIGAPDETSTREAAYGLLKFNEAALQQLRGAILDPDPGMRRKAAIGMGYLGSWGKAVETPLRAALRDSDTSVRIAVVAALGRVNSDWSRAALRLALSDPDASVTKAAEEIRKRTQGANARLVQEAADKEERRIQNSPKPWQVAMLCLPGLLALLLMFRFQVLSEPPPLPLSSRILCLASGLSLCAAVITLLVHFYPSSLRGIHVDAWILVFLLCACASFVVMKQLRRAWAWADKALAGETPRDAYNHLSMTGFLLLALATCLGGMGYLHMLHWQIGMLTLTATLVIPCLIVAATSLSQRRRVRAMAERFPVPESAPEDTPERPMGVALFSLLAMATGLALITFGYFGITSDIPRMYSNSMSAGYGLLVGIIALVVGLPAVVAGRSAYLLEESGRRLLVGFYWLLCVGPLIPLAIVALIYLNSSGVTDKFRDDVKGRDGEDIARDMENRSWRWMSKHFRR